MKSKDGVRMMIVLGIGVLMGRLIPSCSSDYRPILGRFHKTDTVVIYKTATPVVVKQPSKPQVVIRYLRDTARRQLIERSPILAGLNLGKKGLSTFVIDTSGQVDERRYPIPDLRFVTIRSNDTGQVSVLLDSAALNREHRKHRWRRMGNWALVGVAFVAGTIIGDGVATER